MTIVVADAGPLIGISRVQHLTLLRQLYGVIVIPERVRAELRLSSHRPGAQRILEAFQAGWIHSVPVQNSAQVTLLGRIIDAGEAEAIQLAIELHADLLLIDDLNGRKAARRKGLPITGTGGILVAAKRAGFLKAVAPVLDELVLAGYRFSPALCQQILKLAGE